MFKMLVIYSMMAWLLTTLNGCGTGNTFNITDLFDGTVGNVVVGDSNQTTAAQQQSQTTTQEFKREFAKQRKMGTRDASKDTSKLASLIPPLPRGRAYYDTAQALWEGADKEAFLAVNKPMRDARLDPTLKLIALATWTLSPQKYKHYNGVRTVAEQAAKYPKFTKCRGPKCPHVRKAASDFFICKKNNCGKAEWVTARCAYILGFGDYYAKWLSENRLAEDACLQREIITWDACHMEKKTGGYCK